MGCVAGARIVLNSCNFFNDFNSHPGPAHAPSEGAPPAIAKLARSAICIEFVDFNPKLIQIMPAAARNWCRVRAGDGVCCWRANFFFSFKKTFNCHPGPAQAPSVSALGRLAWWAIVVIYDRSLIQYLLRPVEWSSGDLHSSGRNACVEPRHDLCLEVHSTGRT